MAKKKRNDMELINFDDLDREDYARDDYVTVERDDVDPELLLPKRVEPKIDPVIPPDPVEKPTWSMEGETFVGNEPIRIEAPVGKTAPILDDIEQVEPEPVETDLPLTNAYGSQGGKEKDFDYNDLIAQALIQLGPELVGYMISGSSGIADGYTAGQKGMARRKEVLDRLEKQKDKADKLELEHAKIGKKREEAKTKAKSEIEKKEDSLRQEINKSKEVVDAVVMGQAYDKIKNSLPTGPGDITLIFSFMKLLDPTSVVRESEYATAENAGSVPDYIRNIYNRALEGERLGETRQQFRDQADQLYKQKLKSIKPHYDRYRRIAEKRGLDLDNVIYEPLKAYDMPKPKPKPAVAPSEDDINNNMSREQLIKYLREPGSVVEETE